jgi:hypothetical protein
MSAEQDQLAKNRVLLDTLRQHGDALVSPRPVRHWIYFSDPGKRYEFVTVARSLGYNADCVSDEKLGARPHRALLMKVDRVDPLSSTKQYSPCFASRTNIKVNTTAGNVRWSGRFAG